MANTNAPFGFRYIGLKDGSPGNFGIYTGRIAQANTNKIFTGDVLKPVSGGYFDVQTESSPGSTGEATGGIALGFSWVSSTFGCRIWRPYWPGSGDATGVVDVKVALHPDALFQVQCLLGPVGLTTVGQTVNFAAGAGGNTGSGISSMSIDDGTLGNTTAEPFKVWAIPGLGQPNSNLPTDPTLAYNIVTVCFNNLTSV
jgi:hypothetical protein